MTEKKLIVGVPAEIKNHEYRVALTPVGVDELCRAGHQILIQTGAGLGSGISDQDYLKHGANIIATREEIWSRADLIVKVKEPMEAEWPLMRKAQVIFTYFHFAADEKAGLPLLLMKPSKLHPGTYHF